SAVCEREANSRGGDRSISRHPATAGSLATKYHPPMKALSLIASSLAALAFLVGCTQEDRTRASSTVQDGYQEAKAAVTDAWNDTKEYTFEKKNEFSAAARSMGSRMESEISELRANYSEAKASASRKAAMDELR